MGIGTKRKEITAMKRLTILSVTLVFAMSSLAAAPVSFAAKHTDSDKIESTAVYVQKDTSWFDYEIPKDTYEISTEAQLIGLASLVNENQVDKWKPTRIENFNDVVFVLKKDIKLTQSWNPIGTGSASYFAGVFDGNGHTISGLDIDSDSGFTGLFGYLVGEVRDLNVEGKISSGDGSCGAIAGQMNSEARISNCTADVSISGKDKTGGIAGYNNGGVIEDCINLGKVSGTYKVGGIVGENWGGTVTECGNHGEVRSSKRGVATYGTGGIAGRSVSAESEVSKSYNYGLIMSDTEATGGIVGYTNAEGASIEDSYNKADIRILNKNKNNRISQSYAGGIAGTVGTTGVIIRNCYNAGGIKNADVSGGVIGRYINDSDNQEHYIKNNYYLNDQFKTGIGQIDEENDRSAAKASVGISTGSLSGIATSLSVAYINDTGIYGNGGYPVLRWQEPLSDDEKTYLDNISVAKQRALDKYLAKNAGSSQYGQTIINFFTPANYTNDAMILYNDAKEKHEEKKDK